MSTSAEDLYLQSYPFTTAAALIGSVDRKVIVTLWDGRNLVGVLRTFDQFGNLVIHDGIERIYLVKDKKYAESPRPQVYLIRGENVAFVSELDIDAEDESLAGFERIEYGQALAVHKAASQKALDKNTKDSVVFHEHGQFGAAAALY